MITGWLYRALLWLFPRDFLDEYGQDTALAFDELWRAERGGRRLWLAARACLRVPSAALQEHVARWTDSTLLEARRRRSGRERMEGWMGHIRYALRTLVKAPAFTWSAVLLVGLGVGSVTTIFTIADHLVLRPLPYPASERLVSPEEGSHSGPLYREMERLPGFELWAAARAVDVNLTGEGDPVHMRESQVTEHFFELFGGDAYRGRLIGPGDFPSSDVVVLSEGAWRRIWGGDPQVIGKSVTIDEQLVTVVGILDGDFEAPDPITGASPEIWRPLDWTAEETTSHDFWILEVAGRMLPGMDVATAQSTMDALMERMAPVDENYRNSDGDSYRQLPVVPLSARTAGQFRAGLGLLLGAVALLLLVACANVAHLFLARGLGRYREMAVRRAMGATTRDLVGQLMAESMVVGAVGGVIGILLATLGLRGFLAFSPYSLPRAVPVTLDLRVLGFAVLLSAFTALAFGLVPALRSVARDPGDELRGGGRSVTQGRGARSLRNLLLTGEVALSLVLVASAALLLKSFVTMQTQDPGFRMESVWTLPLTPLAETEDEYVRDMEEIRLALERLGEVETATYGLSMPLQHTGGGRCCWRSTLSTQDESAEYAPAMHPVSVDYFNTLEIPIREGRAWSVSEVQEDPIPVVISGSLATELFESTTGALNRLLVRNEVQYRIIGIVGEVRHYGLDADHGPALYLPMERIPFSIPLAHMAVRLRTQGSAGAAAALRNAVWSVAPDLPIPTVQPMDAWARDGSAGRRFDAALFGAFAMVALLLAAGGLCGTLLYITGQRQRELAIRIAMGASQGAIERGVLRGGVGLAAAGVAVGLAGSWIASRFLESRLFGVEPMDPLALAGAAALLLATSAAASWLPARQAARTDPLVMLKAE